MTKTLPALLALFLLLASPAAAVNCHCFNQRDFDPANPASADPYVLATAGNSLLAGSVGAEKSVVVRHRMGGAGETDLWIALFAARATGLDGASLLAEFGKQGSWPKTFASLGIDLKKVGPRFAELLPSDEKGAARALADGAMAKAFECDQALLTDLGKAGASIPEAVVALFIRLKSGADPVNSLKTVKAGGATWGKLLVDAGVPVNTLSPKIVALARR